MSDKTPVVVESRQSDQGMPDILVRLFNEADAALFYLHNRMEWDMKDLPGSQNWREIFGLRLKLNTYRTLAGNNFSKEKA